MLLTRVKAPIQPSRNELRTLAVRKTAFDFVPISTLLPTFRTTRVCQRSCWPVRCTGDTTYSTQIWELADSIEKVKASYFFDGAASAFLQGVPLPPPKEISVCVQWDQLLDIARVVSEAGKRPTPVERVQGGISFFSCLVVDRREGVARGPASKRPASSRSKPYHDQSSAGSDSSTPPQDVSPVSVKVWCRHNWVVATDPHRLQVNAAVGVSRAVWVRSLTAVRADALKAGHSGLSTAITRHLQQLQAEVNAANFAAWQADSDVSWYNRLGPPSAAAQKLVADPALHMWPLTQHLGDLKGKRFLNVLGSHGSKAVAAALMGAASPVTVVDVSHTNAHYARDLAAAAGVELRYLVCDVLALPQEELRPAYDVLVMEMGVLHYFLDLAPLMNTLAQLMAPGGRLVLREFHPVSTKLVTSRGAKHKITGNYFSTALVATDVAHSKHTSTGGGGGGRVVKSSETAIKVQLRQWTLGEVVSAVAATQLRVVVLEEEAGSKLDDVGLPKVYTLVAQRS